MENLKVEIINEFEKSIDEHLATFKVVILGEAGNYKNKKTYFLIL